ncbi:amino acid permease [Acidocella sp.]|uniref:amino acid permease n=1 Tax=Acidocella sp. TaxID=50710 RepID=UPI0026229349|nr:amino acid permease [Acidocella sp.]
MSQQTEQEILAADAATLHKMGYAQELSRRMHGFSNFAVSFSIICILAGGITAFQNAYSGGGAFDAVIGWIAGSIFALVVGCSMAQIASAYPTAGGLYHWSSILGGRAWGWVTAWFNLLGLIFVIASVNVGVYLLFNGLILTNIFGINTAAWAGYWPTISGGWPQVLAVVLITGAQGLFNHFGIRTTTKLIDFSGYLILVVAVALTATMLYAAPHLDFARLIAFHNFSGAPGGGVLPHSASPVYLFLLALLYPLYTITGFDGSAHTSEETVDARRNVPRGILNAIFWSAVFGIVMLSSFILAMPDPVKAAGDGSNIIFNLMAGLGVPTALKDVLYVGIVLSNFLCALAGVTSTSRMVYAFSRDGGLPGSKWLKQVDSRHRSPVAAIWFTVVLSIAATLYSPAFAALAVGCAMFLYISYAMPVLAGLFAEGKAWTEFGPFRLGILSKPFAVITVLGAVLIIYIGTRPPYNILDNYLIGLLVLLAVIWFSVARTRFPGPPIGAGEIAARSAEIMAEEKALASAVD